MSRVLWARILYFLSGALLGTARWEDLRRPRAHRCGELILERDFQIPADVSHELGRNHESFRQGRTISVYYPEVPQ
jgi:hypothetical protein